MVVEELNGFGKLLFKTGMTACWLYSESVYPAWFSAVPNKLTNIDSLFVSYSDMFFGFNCGYLQMTDALSSPSMSI